MADPESGGDPFNLTRFVTMQDPLYGRISDELRRGRKTSHWMWFVFPQIAGLGHSPMAVRYAISGADEARAYLLHPVLGPRLREAAELVLAADASSPETIFGSVDAAKLRSSMTLFAAAADAPDVFQRVLDRYYAGAADPLTLSWLAKSPPATT